MHNKNNTWPWLGPGLNIGINTVALPVSMEIAL